MKKILALDPRVRGEDCDHAHVPFRGAIPNTGPRVCSMCGSWEIPSDVWNALKTERKHVLQDGTLAFLKLDHLSGATVLQPCFVRDR